MDKVLIIGTGPAGMGCASRLADHGVRPVILEKEMIPGGLCRTIDFSGYLFDIGGHRFLTKHPEVSQFWKDNLKEGFLRVQRLSRIYYNQKYFNYPLSIFNVLNNLGLLESARCVLSFIRDKYFNHGLEEKTLDGWVTRRFGKRLFNIFFKKYTEKVWGRDCQNISADWAKQRIMGLSLRVALKKAFGGGRDKKQPKTLAEEFLYPRKGPGQFFEELQRNIEEKGGVFSFGKKVLRIKHDEKKVLSVLFRDELRGEPEEVAPEYVFSTMPLSKLIQCLSPEPPQEVLDAARSLTFRSFLVVNVILDQKDIFADQWLYIHTPHVKLARIQNYKNWSPSMVKDPSKTTLGLEYFCDENDVLWRMNDVDLINYALNELQTVGIADRRHLVSGFVVRAKDAYPFYSMDYRNHLSVIEDYLKKFENLSTMGRAGLFRYCNSDEAFLMGMRAAESYAGVKKWGLWQQPLENEYIES